MVARALSLSRRALLLSRPAVRSFILPPSDHSLLHGAAAAHHIPTPASAAAPIFLPSRNLHQSPLDSRTSMPLSSSLVVAGEDGAAAEGETADEQMSEFLSRFVWKMKKKICEAYPGIDRPTRDGMLLVIAQKVVSQIERSGGTGGDLLGLSGSASLLASDPSLDLSPHLWVTAWEVSSSVLEDMRKTRKRELMKRFLHSDNVKGMCRFAADVGIRGNMLREFRFKWALEEMEEWEFFQGLNHMVDEARGRDGFESEDVDDKQLKSLPQRQGKIKYKIHGLDLSNPIWTEATNRVQEAEKRIEPEGTKPIMGKSRVVTERILDLSENEDPSPLLAEWADLLEPKRADWIALLDRIKERNLPMYFKIAEFLLSEESFQPNIRDYSRLVEAHSEANRFEHAERILEKMKEKDIKPDILTSIVLVHMYSKVGNLKLAHEEFESIRKQGFRPDHKVFQSMIRVNLMAGHAKDAEMLLREMETFDMKPPKEIYIELLRAFSQRGEVDGAQRIVNTMQFAGMPQTLESSTLLIEAYGKAVNPDQARSTFDFMIRSGQKPDDRCIASMIAAYEKKNLLDKALDLLLNLENDGFKPGIATYTVLADWLGRLLLVDEVEQILEKIAEKGDPPFQLHVSLCDMYSRVGLEGKALGSLKILLAKKELLNGVEFERIINGLVAGGLVQEAKRVHDAMLAQGLDSSEQTKMKLMAADTMPRQKSRFQK